MQDFDRLRSGTMHENHFISALSIAGLDRFLSSQQIGTIAAAYRVQVTSSLSMVDWVRFADDIEQIFTIKARANSCLYTESVMLCAHCSALQQSSAHVPGCAVHPLSRRVHAHASSTSFVSICQACH